jgi:multiple sugar transport system permease protein
MGTPTSRQIAAFPRVNSPHITTFARRSLLLPGRIYHRMGKIMTAASLASIFLLAVFLIFQKQIINGIALTGLKA